MVRRLAGPGFLRAAPSLDGALAGFDADLCRGVLRAIGLGVGLRDAARGRVLFLRGVPCAMALPLVPDGEGHHDGLQNHAQGKDHGNSLQSSVREAMLAANAAIIPKAHQR